MESMTSLDALLPIIGLYDFRWVEEQAHVSEDRVLIVDVGGGKGHAIETICKKHTAIPFERCVLQDRKEVIEELGKSNSPSFHYRPHDFHLAQPIKGA
jgi:hypothetical protein